MSSVKIYFKSHYSKTIIMIFGILWPCLILLDHSILKPLKYEKNNKENKVQLRQSRGGQVSLNYLYTEDGEDIRVLDNAFDHIKTQDRFILYRTPIFHINKSISWKINNQITTESTANFKNKTYITFFLIAFIFFSLAQYTKLMKLSNLLFYSFLCSVVLMSIFYITMNHI